jgi:7,8-dihydropterin-6-yl-methyl-4-(beta-D-ribofuranosyl)aminobenzene 5'-phosphate synthase
MRITCIVDDRAQPDSRLRAEHGVSFLIESDDRFVLFDTGGSGPVLLHNLAVLDFAQVRIEALVLSHAHNDHTGGLPGLLDQVQGVPLYAHPDVFRERFRKTDTGLKQVGPAVDRAELAECVVLQLDAEPVEVLPGVWTSGAIAPRPEPEGRSPYHMIRRGRGWTADPYRDDIAVVLHTEAGLVLVCGCCHAGLLNTMAHVRRTFGSDPVAVVGGIHLVHTDEPTLGHVVSELRDHGSPKLWVGHCTGNRAFFALKAAFGDGVALCQAGTVLRF